MSGRFAWNTTTSLLANLAIFHGNLTLDGLLIGVGLEYAFLNNWTVKFEYDYLGFEPRMSASPEPARNAPPASVSRT